MLDLLEVPALRSRFGLAGRTCPGRWMEAGIRWGSTPASAPASTCQGMEQENTWAFGLRRLLLGYAVGNSGAWRASSPSTTSAAWRRAWPAPGAVAGDPRNPVAAARTA
ncbi:hypothetical protein DSL92_06735 [Billgrantia gudaonensis]|uniref:Uncharacterized protein n=1 Tax=Billgrantia gudaonensis TaxID=376427 RepID=A0A3S0Q114_9GAMM|nr:hypothetical protein DSL92_06735 [Halomonas gudaonensis]